MKKVILLLCVGALFLTGCGSDNSTADKITGYSHTEGATDATAFIEAESSTVKETSSAEETTFVTNPTETSAQTISPDDAEIDIGEKYFITQINEIYYNLYDYAGKTIHLEGISDVYTDDTGIVQYGVYRFGPGCCGNDGVAGFTYVPAENVDMTGIELDDWVEVTGTLVLIEDGRYLTPVIENAVVVEKPERGKDTVEN